MKFKVFPNGKINIGLNIDGVQENGYHILDMIMVPIDLCDILEGEIYKEEGNLKITTNKKDIPTNNSNIIYKAYDAFYKKTKLVPRKVDIHLEKRIPYQAGLGGGSSDAAFFIKLLNEFHKEILKFDELIELAKQIGADVPFFIINKPSRVRGIGEKIEVLNNRIKNRLMIIKPKFGVSTVYAYSQVKKIKSLEKANIEKIINGLESGNIEIFKNEIKNSIEQALLTGDMNIQEFRKRLAREEKKFYMSGSGSAYYTFLSEEEKICDIEKRFKDCEVILCNFK